jgi:hypothetical protein
LAAQNNCKCDQQTDDQPIDYLSIHDFFKINRLLAQPLPFVNQTHSQFRYSNERKLFWGDSSSVRSRSSTVSLNRFFVRRFAIVTRFSICVFWGVGAIALTACGKLLDTTEIESSIQESIVKQGGTSLKSVICPQNIKPAEGQVFECVGVLESNSGFAIPVTQQDGQGKVQWEVPSVKGLLNMAKIQTAVQEGLQKEVGQVTIDCGSGTYKAAKLGEIFECKLVKRSSKPESNTSATDVKLEEKSEEKTEKDEKVIAKVNLSDKIQVTIEPSGDVSWQRIIEVPTAPSVASSTLPSLLPSSTQTAPTKPDEKPEPLISSPAPPAGKSAEEFLNQPGAANDFE